MAVRPGYDLQARGYAQLRAASADRERAIDVLKSAFAEGRLDINEFAERVSDVHASKSYGELAALTADLPAGPLGTLPSWRSPVTVPPVAADEDTATKYPPTSVFAVLSFLSGLVVLVFAGAVQAVLPALVCGLIALPDTGAGGKRGRWMAVAGIVIALAGFGRFMRMI
jgi:hypothetical protein